MPELLEVETTRRALAAPLKNQTLLTVVVRCKRLRWDIPVNTLKNLYQQTVVAVKRRAKYLLIELSQHTVIIHFGMSGTLRILKTAPPATKHDHVDFIFTDFCLRFNDPRKFGAILMMKNNEAATCLQHLGVEPLTRTCNGGYLFKRIQGRSVAIKNLLMNNKVIVGIGNIYAAEGLFAAKISPLKPAQTLTIEECQTLIQSIKKILRKAIQAGGTTLKDF